jgi:hypothetical protein
VNRVRVRVRAVVGAIKRGGWGDVYVNRRERPCVSQASITATIAAQHKREGMRDNTKSKRKERRRTEGDSQSQMPLSRGQRRSGWQG